MIGRGWSGITRYQWLILFVAWLGWIFDAMDSTLYTVVLHTSLRDLLGPGATTGEIGWYGGAALSIFLVGWAIGGIFFGALADRFGRAKIMTFTILIYSLFTGLTAFAQSWGQLALARFITALGIGGEWAAGAALVAEVWPEDKRAKAAGLLQSAWAFGYFLTALINLVFGKYGWRVLFLVGVVPALSALLIRLTVREPERWIEASGREEGGIAPGRISQLFSPALRKATWVGSGLAFVAVFGLWGATNWTPTLIRDLLGESGLTAEEISRSVSYAVMALNAGEILGYLSFPSLADRVGRRRAFFLMLLGSLVMLQVAFLGTRSYNELLFILPLLGFFNNGIFSGFPIYLPELYPTPLRATGAGFCFNVGRVLAAAGPLSTGALIFWTGSFAHAVGLIGLIYLLGMVILLWAPETRGKPLPP